MRNLVRCVAAVALTLLVALPASAQFNGKEGKDFGLWMTMGAEKKINKKWSLGLEFEYRLKDNIEAGKRWGAPSRWNVALTADYKPLSWLKLDAGYKFMRDYSLAEWNEEHPEIQVSREAIDRSDSYAYDNKIATAVTSNDLPSIFYVDGPQVSYYAANGIIVPITEYFSEEDMADIVPSTVAQCTYDGELYAMSATESGVAFYYNKDMLKEAGIDTDDLDSRTLENPVTWEEMADIAEKCTTDEHVGAHIIMDHGEGLPYALEPMYISKGKDYISEDGNWYTGDALKDIRTYKPFRPELKGITRVFPDLSSGSGALLAVQKGTGLFAREKTVIAARIDAYIIVMHGLNGEDGTLQGMMELMNIPYTSTGVAGSALGMDKIMMKQFFKGGGLPVLPGIWFTRSAFASDRDKVLNSVETELGFPVFVKPTLNVWPV